MLHHFPGFSWQSVHPETNQGPVCFDYLPGLFRVALTSESTYSCLWCVWVGAGECSFREQSMWGLIRVFYSGISPHFGEAPCFPGASENNLVLPCSLEGCSPHQPALPIPFLPAPPPPGPALVPTQPLYLTLSRGLRRACLPDGHGWRQGAAGQGRNHLALGIQKQLGCHSLDLQALGWCRGCHASRVHYPRKRSNNLRGNKAGTPGVRPVSGSIPNPNPHTGRGRGFNKSFKPSGPQFPHQ